MQNPHGDKSGGLRTLQMARGSMQKGTASPPGASTSSNSLAGFRHALPSAAASTTPDEREPAQDPQQMLDNIGILELLALDDRLVFVLDLSLRGNSQPGPLQLLFGNAPLQTSNLQGIISGETIDGSAAMANFFEFKAWAMSFVRDREAMDVVLPGYVYAGLLWTCATIRKRFRVFYGSSATNTLAPTNRSAGNTPIGTSGSRSSLSAPSGAENQSRLTGHTPLDADTAPHDYFGDARADMVDATPSKKSSTPNVPGRPAAVSPASQKPARVHSAIRDSLRNVLSASSNGPSTSSPLQPRSISTFPEASSSDQIYTLATLGSSRNMLDEGFFDWTRLPSSAALPRHIQFARSIDWSATDLGPMDSWAPNLRFMCNLLMASPHPAAMYWGDSDTAIYNEAYILLAGHKHPQLMGMRYREAWAEIYDEIKGAFNAARTTGQAVMQDDDHLFINRAGYLEETFFSWSLIPLVGEDGRVCGFYNPAFEKTRRRIAERRMLTLREVGECTASARDVKNFWKQVLRGLEYNEYDTPFVLLYSINDDQESEDSSIHSNSVQAAKQCCFEGSLPPLPEGHRAAPAVVELKGSEGLGGIFKEAMMMDRPVLLETSAGTLDSTIFEDIECRGFPEKPRAAVVCPIHPTTADAIYGFLVIGINPRRPYDDDYALFMQLLSRQMATSMASVVLFEEEIRRGQRAAKLAALDRIELSEQLAARTQEAVESETKFTRMAELAPVGMFIADRHGKIVFTNETFHTVTCIPHAIDNSMWKEAIVPEHRDMVLQSWEDLVQRNVPMALEYRFTAPWNDPNGNVAERWVLGSAYPETYPDGQLKSIFGSITDISQQKWAEGLQKKRTEEANEMRRQQSRFIDIICHEIRNPLSATLQCADEISVSLMDYKADSIDPALPVSLLDNNIDAAQTIALCGLHQTRILNDVLTLSKLEGAILLVTPVEVRPTAIVQQALKMFETEVHTADIKMTFQIDKSLRELQIDWVCLDPSRLLQVLINLTTNAIKFTTPQPNRTIIINFSASRERPDKIQWTGDSYIPSRKPHTDVTAGTDWGEGELLYLNFAVQDTGKGLSEAEKKLMFLRFSQASPKTHVQYGGSGLGLFISRELVELQGGEIGVSSETGKGSTFAFYVQARRSSGPAEGDHQSPIGSVQKPNASHRLSKISSITRVAGATEPPRAASPGVSGITIAGSASDNAALPSPTTLSFTPPDGTPMNAVPPERLRILVVEDNEVNQRVLSKQLRNLGSTVTVANHGQEALEHLQKTRFWKQSDVSSQDSVMTSPDPSLNAQTAFSSHGDGSASKAAPLNLSVILMDMEMPVMDGLTCTRRIRQLQEEGTILRHIPIIAVSANARSAHVQNALEAGMDDVVSKPFRIPELIPKIQRLVAKWQPFGNETES